jgi:hypothetical protein
MLQVVPRVWPAEAVHDTVQAVVRGSAFRRSLQSSLAERLMQWMGGWFRRVFGFLDGVTSLRTIVVWLVGLLVLAVVVRLVLAARARDDDASATSRSARVRRGEDPWRAAERLLAEGRFEDAAHALYRGVLVSVAQAERVRLDPSKTSGDYARELRARGAPSLPAFRAFVRRFDAVVYGHAGTDAASLQELSRLASPFAPRARAA